MKRGQMIGMDMIMGIVIFVIALSTFFMMIKDSAFLNQEKKLVLNADYIMRNIDNVPSSCVGCDFLDGARLDLSAFDSMFRVKHYNNTLKGIVLGDIAVMGYDNVDFCIFIQRSDDKVIGHAGPFSPDIIVGKNGGIAVRCGDQDAPDQLLTDPADEAKPECRTSPTTESYVLSKPVVVYPGAGSPYFGKMTILICASDDP